MTDTTTVLSWVAWCCQLLAFFLAVWMVAGAALLAARRPEWTWRRVAGTAALRSVVPFALAWMAVSIAPLVNLAAHDAAADVGSYVAGSTGLVVESAVAVAAVIAAVTFVVRWSMSVARRADTAHQAARTA